MFSYRNYHDKLVTDQERKRTEDYDRENDKSTLRTEVYSEEFSYHPYSRSNVNDYQQLLYQEVPQHGNLEYVPAPFRERFEIWLWKIEGLGIAKIKNSYFTPDVSYFKEILILRRFYTFRSEMKKVMKINILI